MTADVRMAEVAALVGDPARANILAALMGGRALTASELVRAAGVSPQTTSGHLGKLADGRLIACVKQGRHRYYRIATHRVAEMLKGIMAVVADAPPRHRPASKVDEAMRTARTCYDHFAGKLGVGLADALCAHGYVLLTGEGGEVTDSGVAFFDKFGVDLAAARGHRRILDRAAAASRRQCRCLARAALLRPRLAQAHAGKPRADAHAGRPPRPERNVRRFAVEQPLFGFCASLCRHQR
jgi:DNA-binding transcriptional ArsR family regulator